MDSVTSVIIFIRMGGTDIGLPAGKQYKVFLILLTVVTKKNNMSEARVSNKSSHRPLKFWLNCPRLEALVTLQTMDRVDSKGSYKKLQFD